MNYMSALTKLGNRQSRKLPGRATYLVRKEDHIAVQYHGHSIVKFYPDYCEVSACGWETVTTKARINDYLPYGRVIQRNGTWYFQSGNAYTVKFLPTNRMAYT